MDQADLDISSAVDSVWGIYEWLDIDVQFPLLYSSPDNLRSYQDYTTNSLSGITNWPLGLAVKVDQIAFYSTQFGGSKVTLDTIFKLKEKWLRDFDITA